jgi:hypothetical protein
LQTFFVDQAGTLAAGIDASCEIDFSIVDLSESPELDEPSLVDEFHFRPYDLAKAPLWRVLLIRRAPAAWLLLFSIHPIITDGWSNAILTTELTTIYGALLAGNPAPELDEDVASYGEYCQWIEINLAAPYFDKQQRYWASTLPDAVPHLTLPKMPDAEGTAVSAREPDVALYDLTPERMRRIAAYTRENRVTLYVFLLATLKAFVHRATGEASVLVCTPMAGRTHPKLDNVVGPVVNPVVLFSDLSRFPDFPQFLNGLRQTAAEAYDNQSYPFDLVVDERRRRGLNDPLYSIVFVVQNYEIALELSDTSVEPVFLDATQRELCPLRDVASDIALHIEAFERAETVILRIRFRQPDLSRQDVDRYVDIWFAIIDRITSGRTTTWRDIDEVILDAGLEAPGADQIRLTDGVLDELFGGEQA